MSPNVEFQASSDLGLDGRVLVYNALARRRSGLPVRSVVFLLRPQALPGASGRISESFGTDHRLEFNYKVVRVWEIKPELLLAGGIGTLALAPISAASANDLPAVIDAMKSRLDAELSAQASREVWVAARILTGLRYSPEIVRALFGEVRLMEESTTYQEIIEKGIEKGVAKGIQAGIETGRALEARDVLLRQGRKRLGNPDPVAMTLLDSIGDHSRLEALMDRLLDGSVKSWGELLESEVSHA
jgi:hypothetical protein